MGNSELLESALIRQFTVVYFDMGTLNKHIDVETMAAVISVTLTSTTYAIVKF